MWRSRRRRRRRIITGNVTAGVHATLVFATLGAWSTGVETSTQSRRVTFSRDISPIVLKHCAPCHRPGGAAPFSLLGYDSVRRRAALIADLTARRLMPPWKAAHTDPGFVGEDRLADADIAAIGTWVADGMPNGAATDPLPDTASMATWQSGTPDLVLTAPSAYEVRPDGPDLFHIFVIPVPLDGTRFVRGLEFEATNRAVHHANILVDRTRRSREFSGRDEVAEAAGFIPRSAQYPEGQILGWVPGRADPLLSPELSWRLEPGSDLVVQVHLQPTGKRERVQPRIALYFSETAPTRTPALLRLGRQDLDIPAGDRHYMTSDSFVLPVEAAVLALKPHAHYRAKSVRARAVLPDGTARDLVAIADWDLRWQQVYRYVLPVTLPKGTRLVSEFTYDNSADNPRNPVIPPTAVRWGPWSSDEMGDCWIQLLPSNPDDLCILARDAGQKMATMDLVGYERLIDRNPRNVALRDEAGMLALQVGRPADAVSQFQAALRIADRSAGEHFNLGLALAMAGRMDEAIAEYRRSIQLDATSAPVHDSLGVALAATGELERAKAEYRSGNTPRSAQRAGAEQSWQSVHANRTVRYRLAAPSQGNRA